MDATDADREGREPKALDTEPHDNTADYERPEKKLELIDILEGATA